MGDTHFPDDGVVCGGDRVEDALDAPQRLLTPRGDAVEGFVIVFQGPTTLTEGRTGATQSRQEDLLLPCMPSQEG